jgi:hypothetical protein
MSTVKTLKTYLGADLRRFPIVGGALPSLAALKAQLASAYGLAPSTTFVLKYVDEDGEQITAANDQERLKCEIVELQSVKDDARAW